MVVWSAALLVCIAASSPPDMPPLEAYTDCAFAQSAPLEPPREVALALYRGPGVDLAQAQAALAPARAWWARRGVRLTPHGPWRTLPETEALASGDAPDLTAATAPLRALLARIAVPPAPRVNVVVLARLVAPDPPGAPAGRAFEHLDGLTLAPWLARDGATGPALLAALALPARFTPTVVISRDGWRRRRPADVDALVAHELGHAFGLGHTRTPGGLMTPGPHRCVPGLTAAEQAALVLP